MRFAYFLCVVSAAALAACSSAPKVTAPIQLVPAAQASTPAPAPAPTDPLSGLKQFTLADLTAASADAHSNNDQTAYQCYDYLIKVLPTLPSFTPGSTVGAVLAFQKVRDLQTGLVSVNGQFKQVNLACAPLVIDTQTTINKLILIGAGGAATGGTIAPIIGAIP